MASILLEEFLSASGEDKARAKGDMLLVEATGGGGGDAWALDEGDGDAKATCGG